MADNLAAILAQTQRPEKSVDLCLRGDLFAQRERLLRDLPASVDSLAGTDPDVQIRIDDIETQMRDSTRTFTFRAVGRSEFRSLREAYKKKDKDAEASDEYLADLIAVSLVDPELSREDINALLAALSDGQASVLEDAAWTVNQETDLPFTSRG